MGQILQVRASTRNAISLLMLVACAILCAATSRKSSSGDLRLHWEKNILTISSPRLPGEKLEIWYMEAFCKRGSTARQWRETVIAHQTRLVGSDPEGKTLKLESVVDGRVRVRHDIRAVADGVEFRLTLTNLTDTPVDIEWAQPCVRVDRFTGLGQQDYIRKCFIFTEHGLTMLDQTRRREEALYKGGQVYVPAGVNLDDVNPRPISPDVPANPLIGCFSGDGKYLVATAWKPTQELFQGVIVCIHNDFRIGGLTAHETKHVRGKLYFLGSDIEMLVNHYRADFSSMNKP